MRLFVGDDWAESHHDIEVVDEAGAVLRSEQLAQPAALTAAYAATVRSLIAVISALNEQVTVLEEQVREHFCRHRTLGGCWSVRSASPRGYPREWSGKTPMLTSR
jgi:hypothetical protein